MSSEVEPGPTAPPFLPRSEHFQAGLLVQGRYRIISELGAGAYGTVCLAEDESTGHRVAIRLLPRRVAEMPQAAQAVLRMGRSIIVASITHPGLVRVLEFGEIDNGRPFAVMELLEGCRLSEVLSEGKSLDVAAALRLALDLGGAVEALHNMGLVHLALCPRNVMVLGDGRVKLMDIELAGLREGRELEGVVSAEPPAEYLSPEQILRAPVSEKTDVYAYGAILHALLCGVPPFEAATREAVLAKHLKEAPAPVRRRRHEVPGSVERAVTLALYKQPEPRPLIGDVLNLLWTGAHGPAPHRNRLGVGLIAGGALAGLAVAAVVWVVPALRSPAPPPLHDPPVAEQAPASTAPASRTPETETSPTPTPGPVAPTMTSPVAEQPPLSATPVPSAPAADTTTTPTPRPAAPAMTPPVAKEAPVSPAPASRAPAAETRPIPPAVKPTAPAAVSPVSVRAPAAPPAAPSPPRAERREPPQPPPAPPAPERSPASRGGEDAGAVIDWLLRTR
jgi:serine/threonine protein kinase